MKNTILTLAVILFAAFSAVSQTAEFTYQGSLKDGANAATGNYDLEFRLYDAVTAGNQVGVTVSRPGVAVSGGVFSVRLDFTGAITSPFSGADRYLEISVRPTGGGGYTVLGPRQRVGSSPYAIKSLTADNAATATSAITANTATNSTQLGGLAANRYVSTDAGGNAGLGTAPTASRLAVSGNIEIVSGALKFPDATTQSTAGLTSVTAGAPFSGNGTPASPLVLTTPLPIRDIDGPTRQPFAITVLAPASGASTNLTTVPAGKMLFIQSVSASMNLNAGGKFYDVSIGVNGGTTKCFLTPTYSATVGSFDYYTVSQPVSIFANAGTTVVFNRSFSGATGATLTITIFGYYVDTP